MAQLLSLLTFSDHCFFQWHCPHHHWTPSWDYIILDWVGPSEFDLQCSLQGCGGGGEGVSKFWLQSAYKPYPSTLLKKVGVESVRGWSSFRGFCKEKDKSLRAQWTPEVWTKECPASGSLVGSWGFIPEGQGRTWLWGCLASNVRGQGILTYWPEWNIQRIMHKL